MKLMKPILLALCFAATRLSAGPITVTGGGTFYRDVQDRLIDGSFQGDDGPDHIFVSFTSKGTVLSTAGLADGLAALNLSGKLYSFPRFAFSFSNNGVGGFVSADGTVRLDLLGVVTVLQENCTATECRGTYSITAPPPVGVPEPGTWLLSGAGLLALVIRRR